MKNKFIKYFTDPISKLSLNELHSFSNRGDEIISGILKNSSGDWYPVIGGVPRVLVNEMKTEMLSRNRNFYLKYSDKFSAKIKDEWLRSFKETKDSNDFITHQKNTADSFAYEWDQIYEENSFEKNNFLHFVGPFIDEKTIEGKEIIDIGCGSGRFTKWPALMSAKIVFGTDLGESVDVAYRLTKKMNNVCIVQADIYNMPFKNKFDIAYSIGVLHHLPQPKLGFLGLKNTLKIGGLLNIWVYNRRNNKRALYFYEPIRSITRRMPKALLYKLCYVPAFAVHVINGITKWLNIRNAIFSYYGNFTFNMKLNDAFDVLATPKSNYYYVEEIVRWFTEAKLKNIKSFEHPEAGITCIGRYGK